MTSRSILSWNNFSERGILTSGWNPCQTGDFSFEVSENGKVIAVYEDLRPGNVACALFCLPPLIAFAPVCCPVLSMTSRAFCWEFHITAKTQQRQINCLFRKKSFFSEDIHTFYNISNMRLESKQKAHVESDSMGQLKQQSIVVHQVVMEHDGGTYEFPSDIPHGHQLQSFVTAVRRLINPNEQIGDYSVHNGDGGDVYTCSVIASASYFDSCEAIPVIIPYSEPVARNDEKNTAPTEQQYITHSSDIVADVVAPIAVRNCELSGQRSCS